MKKKFKIKKRKKKKLKFKKKIGEKKLVTSKSFGSKEEKILIEKELNVILELNGDDDWTKADSFIQTANPDFINKNEN